MQNGLLQSGRTGAALLLAVFMCTSCGEGNTSASDESSADSNSFAGSADIRTGAIEKLTGSWVTTDGCDFATASLSLAGPLEDQDQLLASLVVSGLMEGEIWRATLNVESAEKSSAGFLVEYWIEDESAEAFNYYPPLSTGELTLSANTLYVPFPCGERAFVAKSSLDQQEVMQEFAVVIGVIRDDALGRFEERIEEAIYDLSTRGLLDSSVAEETYAEIARTYFDEIYLAMLPATQAYVLIGLDEENIETVLMEYAVQDVERIGGYLSEDEVFAIYYTILDNAT